MMYMNDYDLMTAGRRFENTPNRRAVVETVDNLRLWANANSDGWAYWPAPCRAARPLMRLVASTTNAMNDAMVATDATPTVVRRAASPLKAFCTRAQRAGIMTAADASQILAPVEGIAR